MMLSRDQRLAGPDSAIEGVLLAQVHGERRIEGRGGDFPDGRLVRVGIAVIDEQTMEELEEVPRRAELAEGVDELPLGEGRVEEFL